MAYGKYFLYRITRRNIHDAFALEIWLVHKKAAAQKPRSKRASS